MPTRLIYPLVAISGLSGLMYEILWIRALGLHFGTSTPAIATVSATFMAGMAVGNLWFGPRADRSARPFALYRRIELGIALAGVAASLIMLRAGGVLDEVARLSVRLGAFGPWLHGAAVALLLLAPTALMGGTLPVLSRALSREGHSGRTIGALYAWNTVGAMFGALLPDFWLVRCYGLTITALVACGGNLLVAALVRSSAAPNEPVSEPNRERVAVNAAILLSAVSGFAGMVLEVLWSRTLEHWTPNLASSLSVLLAVYLGTLAAGAASTRRAADRSAAPLRHGALWLGLASVSAVLPLVFAPEWRGWELRLLPVARGIEHPSMLHLGAEAALHALYLAGAACLCMGAAFPFVIRALVRPGETGRSTATLFTVNTLAGTSGALIACFVWLPELGQQYAYMAAALVLAASGGLACFPLDAARRKLALASASCLALVLLVLFLLPPDHLQAAGFGRGVHIVAAREGGTTSAAADAQMECGKLLAMTLRTPGIAMSDTSMGARRYMGMMAHAAMLTTPAPKQALLICFGVGNTARALLSYPSLQRLDVVDISREVLSLSPYFGQARGKDPLTDPRTRVRVEDGRHHLLTRDDTYDVITMEPPPPEQAGVVNLYSREFYHVAKQRLRPQGVITQWLPSFQLADSASLAIVAAFVSEFPHSALLYGQDEQFVLIGSPAPLRIDPARAEAVLRAPSVQQSFVESAIGDLSDIYGALLLDDAELRGLVTHIAPLTDDRPSLQYPWEARGHGKSFATLFPERSGRALAALPASASPELQRRVAAMERALKDIVNVLHYPAVVGEQNELVLGNAIGAALAESPGREAFLNLLQADRDHADVSLACLGAPGADAVLQLGREGASAAGIANGYALLDLSLLTLARRAFYLGDYAGALHWLERRTPDANDRARHELLLAVTLRKLGHEADAKPHFAAAASASRSALARGWIEKLGALPAPLAAAAGPFALP